MGLKMVYLQLKMVYGFKNCVSVVNPAKVVLCSILSPVHLSHEGIILFNDALKTFYLWLYGIRHMVKDHSDSERENPLPLHRLLFLINSKGSFIYIIPQTG